jgi:hypothetical protein
VAPVIGGLVADHDVLVRRNRHPNVDTIDGTVAVLRTRRDDGNTTPGNVVSEFLQPFHLVSNCRTDGLRRFGIFKADLQRDLHEQPSSRCARIPRFDRGLIVQDHVQQGIMNFQLSIVFDETQFAEFVHEKAHA